MQIVDSKKGWCGMKKIKKILEAIKNGLVFIFLGFWWVWALILVLVIGYLISISDLPDWFKFFLLK